MKNDPIIVRQHQNETFQSMKDLLDALPDLTSKRRIVAMLAASIDFEIKQPRTISRPKPGPGPRKRY